MGERMSGPKITRSARPAPKPPRPQFPIRKPALVKTADDNVQPINHNGAKVHRVGPKTGKIISWGIIIACMAIGIFFHQRFMEAVSWVHMTTSERAYAEVGQDWCLEPALTVPEYACEAGALGCFTVPQEAVLERMKIQAQAVNEWRAERCLPLM